MLKRDGHVYAQFNTDTRDQRMGQLLPRLVTRGFRAVTLVERAPLPPALRGQLARPNFTGVQAPLALAQVTPYLDWAQQLQQHYAKRIRINVGFEVDYLADFEEWIAKFLEQVGPATQDNLLMVRLMAGRDQQLWSLDGGYGQVADGFSDTFKFPQQFYDEYYTLLLRAVHADLGVYQPLRVSGFDQVRRYQDYFGLPRTLDPLNECTVMRILYALRARRGSIDLDVSGLFDENCNEVLPARWVRKRAQALGIPLVYGSGARDVADVGRAYHAVAPWLAE